MNKYIYSIILFFIANSVFAQHAFFGNRGKLSFDKITFTKARMRDMQQKMSQSNPNGGFGGGGFGGRMFDLDNMPESSTEKYILEFDEKSTLMYIDENADANSTTDKNTSTRGVSMQGGNISARGGRGGNMGGGAINPGGAPGGNRPNQGGREGGGANTRPNTKSKMIFQDLKNNTGEVQIQIDEKYILSDSLQNITWRFTDEYRTIAGFECRRVNGSTPDSLYLVAFYTDELPVSAGPALSSGLPGMILGLAIPEMHIQYWATKLEYTNELVSSSWKDKKSKTLTLDEFVKSFGRYFQRGRDNNSSKRQIQEQLIY